MNRREEYCGDSGRVGQILQARGQRAQSWHELIRRLSNGKRLVLNELAGVINAGPRLAAKQQADSGLGWVATR